MKKLRVLITGCGGDIGQSLTKVLREENIAQVIVGCDIHTDHPGVLIYDHCEVICRVDDERYVTNLKELITKHSINLVILMSEGELRFFTEKNLFNQFEDVVFISANIKAMEVGFDKYETSNFLASIGLPFPKTKLVRNGLFGDYPCILKSKQGRGSQDVLLIQDQDLAEYYLKKRPDDIWQELLLPENEEYTCGLFRSQEGVVRSIIIKRKLQGGYTGFGEVVYSDDITDVLHKLAKSLGLVGSINVQLRLTNRGPIIFEINPRFSSTVYFRHLLGFKDVLWSIQDALGESISGYIPPEKGIRFVRGSKEYILNQ